MRAETIACHFDDTHINTPSKRISRYYNYTIKHDFVNVFCVKKIAREADFTIF